MDLYLGWSISYLRRDCNGFSPAFPRQMDVFYSVFSFFAGILHQRTKKTIDGRRRIVVYWLYL